MTLPISSKLLATLNRSGSTELLEELGVAVSVVREAWGLELGPPYAPGGRTAWVAPARRSGHEVVLKVALRSTEAAHEAEGLRAWRGDGVAVLYESRRLEHFDVLLLERCVPGTWLKACDELEQDVVIAGLLKRLWRVPPAEHPFRSLQVLCDSWTEEFHQDVAARDWGLDPGLAREGIAMFQGLPVTAERAVMLCTDLHAENVLASEREPWLVIDPKPYVGDPTYDALQHMLNCGGRLLADPHAFCQRMAGLLDLDLDRLRLWMFARCVQQSPSWPELVGVARQLAPS